MDGTGSLILRILQPLGQFNLRRLSYWFTLGMITLSIWSLLALKTSFDSIRGIPSLHTSTIGQLKGKSGRGLFRQFVEDANNYVRQHQIRTVFRGSQPAIVCPEIDIPGSRENVTINFNETEMSNVEEEIFREFSFDVRRFSSDLQRNVANLYGYKYNASDQRTPVRELMSKGIKITDDYWYVPGGHWIPARCLPRWKVAIIIPFRDRFVHLAILLRHLVPFMQKQFLEFGIFCVEQANELQFNRAMLMNVGYLEALNFTQWDCFIIHDVDHIPINYGNYYGCGGFPKHFISGDDIWGYKILYQNLFGGVTGFTRTQVTEFNGFPNAYWGWGGEDDDIFQRIRSVGLEKTRPYGHVGWYNVIKHHHESGKKNEQRFCLLNHFKERMFSDGLSNLKYETPTVTLNPLYTNISVNIQQLPWNDTWEHCREAN